MATQLGVLLRGITGGFQRSLGYGFVLALVLGSLQAGANGQTAHRSIEHLHSGTTHRPLFGVDFQEDGRIGFAVGGRGTLVSTEDGGDHWSTEYLETDLALIDIAVNDSRRVAVGQMGLVFVSDGGEWRKVESGTEERLMSVDLNGKGLAVAVGAFGTVLVSTNAGEQWEPIPERLSQHIEDGYDPHLYAVQIDSDNLVTIAGEFGFIAQSNDQGKTWKVRHEGEESLSGLHIRSSGIGFAVGQDGAVLKTTDTGETWQPAGQGLTGNLLGVWSTLEGQVVVPGMRHMYVSDDDGQSWRPVTDGDVNSNWYVQAAASAVGLIAVGHSGRIIKVSKSAH